MMGLTARRGPDGEGQWTDSEHCSLGFRRLAILDLAETGNQPMVTPDGRSALVFNGEIYNYLELRDELEADGVRFNSTGDSQVVLHALARWGAPALDRFNGMFALGFYDRVARSLLLARDHAGIKPLYYLASAGGVVFASQYDAIVAHPWSRHEPFSPEAVGMYLRLGYIPAPRAILRNTHMLEPGAWIRIRCDGTSETGRFFTFGPSDEPRLQGMEAYEAVDAAVTASVRRQLISDVPLGSFLSGGIDSPLVTAKMRAARRGRVKAFTLGTGGGPFDESPDAVAYAREMQVDHVVEQLTPDRALEILDPAVEACGEPFADYSILPTLVICRRARRDVTVMLSGDGGDELFWGYAGRFASIIERSREFAQPHWWRSARWGLKKTLDVGNAQWNIRWPTIGHWYRAKHSRIPEGWLRRIFRDVPDWPADSPLFEFNGFAEDATAEWLRWNEFVGHLTMVLLKVDRASMYSSLEVRVPLLDREVIAVASRVDWRSCLDLESGRGKLPLRHALAREVRHQTSEKRGFTVPLGDWLRGPLRGVFEDAVLGRREIFGLPLDAAATRALFEEHLSGTVDWAWALWVLLSAVFWEQRHYRGLSTRGFAPSAAVQAGGA